jgi:NDP-sugar pyrophosphorylase family protein
MKAIIVNWPEKLAHSLFESTPPAMSQLVDRPFIQHVVESLINQGVESIDFVVGAGDYAIQQLLGDGQRWGSQFQFYIASDFQRPLDCVRHLQSEHRGVLLANATRLPQINVESLKDSHITETQMFCDSDGKWTGWGWVPTEKLEAIPDDANWGDWENYLKDLFRPATEIPTPRILRADTFESIFESCCRVVTGEFNSQLFIHGRERDPGQRICGNVRIHPSAQIEGNVFLGDNVRISKNAIIGPNAFIGDNCVIDRNATIGNSVILPGTYVGPWVDIEQCFVRKNQVVNVRLDVALNIDDWLVVSSL